MQPGPSLAIIGKRATCHNELAKSDGRGAADPAGAGNLSLQRARGNPLGLGETFDMEGFAAPALEPALFESVAVA